MPSNSKKREEFPQAKTIIKKKRTSVIEADNWRDFAWVADRKTNSTWVGFRSIRGD